MPFPIWYPLDADGQPDYHHPIAADEASLPIDPSSDTPPGYTEDQRDQPGGFAADPDVMDTWATSSLSPQIACYWEDDPDLFERTFPMDLRPQAHEIIRTWLFATVTRAHFEHDGLPWATAAISGWVLDPDRKKMSKSKGNVVTPMDTLEAFGADALRYWASSGTARHRHCFRGRPDEGGSAPSGEDPQRQPIRARPRARQPMPSPPRPSTGPCSPIWPI